MKKIGANGQKTLKTLHLITICLWLGGAVAINIMPLVMAPAQSGGELFGYDLARKFLDDFIIIPGAMGCLLTGLFICWLTPWGFFKHRWLVVKWALTIASILFGALVIGPFINDQPPISAELGLEALTDAVYAANFSQGLILGFLQTLVIIFLVVISVLKPWRRRAATGSEA
ncbi:MAG: DUF2269 family protein [Candidatus Adiutrix sp.]|nr:DUF2269 family protein [Candidatus Adiutrix sp.]